MAGQIRRTFEEHWNKFLELYGHKTRDVVKADVKRMLSCGDYSNGYAEYSCNRGEVYVDERAENMAKKLIKVAHRNSKEIMIKSNLQM
jgi:pheromone shutdown protein TraB